MLILFGFLLVIGEVTRADTVWDSGHHEITAGDVFGEIYMYNDATADMFAGEVGKLETHDLTHFNFLGGDLTDLRIHGNGTADFSNGELNRLGIDGNGLLNLYAYDVTIYTTGGYYDRGWIEGKYFSDDSYFSFDFVLTNTHEHINIVPEPASLMLFCLGGLLLRKRRCCI